MKYKLILQGSNDVKQVMMYDPMTSEVFWEETGERPSLEHIGKDAVYKIEEQNWIAAKVTNPKDPELHGRKTKKVSTLKITMGLKCNFACSYCNQAHQPHDPVGGPEDAEALIQSIKKNLTVDPIDPIRIEFWGGEPFVYWKTLKPLAEKVRRAYPMATFNIITNGSLLDRHKVDWLYRMNFNVGISHDGPLHAQNRGPDPLDDLTMRDGIIYALKKLGPNRVGFNSVLTKENVSLVAVKQFISKKLNGAIPDDHIIVNTEELLLPYDASGLTHSISNSDEAKEAIHSVFWETITGANYFSNTVTQKVKNFFSSISEQRPAKILGQKCGMDREDILAIDMKGNATTCQNTSSLTKHNIGNIEDVDAIRLHTSHHWSTREECPNCPVLQLCMGSCLFLEDDLWKAGCENMFTWNLALLAAALFIMTDGLVLVEIQGQKIRYDDVTSVPVIDIEFVKSNGTKKSWKVRKPVGIPVVAA